MGYENYFKKKDWHIGKFKEHFPSRSDFVKNIPEPACPDSHPSSSSPLLWLASHTWSLDTADSCWRNSTQGPARQSQDSIKCLQGSISRIFTFTELLLISNNFNKDLINFKYVWHEKLSICGDLNTVKMLVLVQLLFIWIILNTFFPLIYIYFLLYYYLTNAHDLTWVLLTTIHTLTHTCILMNTKSFCC